MKKYKKIIFCSVVFTGILLLDLCLPSGAGLLISSVVYKVLEEKEWMYNTAISKII